MHKSYYTIKILYRNAFQNRYFKTKKTGLNPVLCFNGGGNRDRLDEFYLFIFLWENSSSGTRSHHLVAGRFRFLTRWGTSPVVRKQHFEVVFFPPANDLRSSFLNLFHFKTKKTGLNPVLCFNGGGNRDRTDDLQIANLSLSQLSYTPNNLYKQRMQLLGHSFFKFIYSLSLHKFIKKTSPLQ